MNRENHKSALKQVQNTRSINSFFSLRIHPNSSQSNIVMPTDADCAEIIWALTVAQNIFSANSCDAMSKIFQAMCPDSQIHRQFSLGTSKCSYVINFGLSPFFQKKLIYHIKKSQIFSTSFDKSFDDTLKKQQMDLVVSYSDSSAQKYCVQYLTSKFPKYCSADDLNVCLDDALKESDLSKMIQLASYGWTFCKLVTSWQRLFHKSR